MGFCAASAEQSVVGDGGRVVAGVVVGSSVGLSDAAVGVLYCVVGWCTFFFFNFLAENRRGKTEETAKVCL
jgi:hypothetical protein